MDAEERLYYEACIFGYLELQCTMLVFLHVTHILIVFYLHYTVCRWLNFTLEKILCFYHSSIIFIAIAFFSAIDIMGLVAVVVEVAVGFVDIRSVSFSVGG